MRRLSALVLALVLLIPGAAAAKDIVADLVVHRIEITSGFSGAELTLFGAVAALAGSFNSPTPS